MESYYAELMLLATMHQPDPYSQRMSKTPLKFFMKMVEHDIIPIIFRFYVKALVVVSFFLVVIFTPILGEGIQFY